MKSIQLLVLVLSTFSWVNAYRGEPDYRLGTLIRPISYTVALKPYLSVADGYRRFTFDGEVFIMIRVHGSNVSEITLNAHMIRATRAWIIDNYMNVGQTVQLFREHEIKINKVAQKLTLNLKEPLRLNGLYLLQFMYRGQIRDDRKGFFRVSYTDSMGNKKWIGLTQSQNIHARSIFPCFDEPGFRAHISLEMNRPARYKTFYNTELLHTTPDGKDRFWDRFASSPEMPTYLFAFILSEFVVHGSDTYKIITRLEHENKTDFAYKVGEDAINAFGDYFEIPYNKTISTLKMAALPEFPYEGMENWGLINYREDILVHERDYTDDVSNRQFTLLTIMHEIAHMWFGNSVTISWWNHFWLNEGFARYFQYTIADELYDEYDLLQQFVVEEVHEALKLDASRDTQPLTSSVEEIQAPSDIDYKFKPITYMKGACIIRMIANLMTKPNFDTAIRDYLEEFMCKSTTPADLFKHFERNWPKPIPIDLKQFFYDYTEQVGYPVLFVNASAKDHVILKQKRFMYDSGDGSNSSLTYIIPITYATDLDPDFNNTYPSFYFSKGDNMTINFEKPIKWIVFNLLQSNYYRVFYDSTTLFNIKAALMESNVTVMPPSNRAQLIDDLFNFANVVMMDYETVFQFLEYLKNETDYLPWRAVFTNLPQVVQRLNVHQQRDFASFLNDTLEKAYTQLNLMEGKLSIIDSYNHRNVINWACKYHLFRCDKHTQDIFIQTKLNGVKPYPDFRETIYCCAMRESTLFTYQTLHNWFVNETFESEKKKLVRAMGCTRRHWDYHYEMIIRGEIPNEYAMEAITSMYTQNPENVQALFVRITHTIEKFAESVGGWSNATDVINDIASYFTTHQQKSLLYKFIKENGSLFESYIPELRHAHFVVESNLRWAEDRLPRLIKYLKKTKSASVRCLPAALFIFINLINVLFYV